MRLQKLQSRPNDTQNAPASSTPTEAASSNAPITPANVSNIESPPEVLNNLGQNDQSNSVESQGNDSITKIFGTPEFKVVASTSRGRQRTMNSRAIRIQRSIFPSSSSESSSDANEPASFEPTKKKKMTKKLKKRQKMLLKANVNS